MSQEGAKKGIRAFPERMDSKSSAWRLSRTAGEEKGGYFSIQLRIQDNSLRGF